LFGHLRARAVHHHHVDAQRAAAEVLGQHLQVAGRDQLAGKATTKVLPRKAWM
jgi:hypothetical protein